MNKENTHATQVPEFTTTQGQPIDMTHVRHPDGRMSSYPPIEHWDNWTEWDSKSWPKKVAKNYQLIPTICFNCESACGLLAYVDKENYEIRKFEGNPVHPGSRGRNCAKGPATHNQIYDPERILHPLKRVGKRGEGKWKRITWDEALSEIAEKMAASRAERRDGIMYHVGRPGEDHYNSRILKAWGTDSHNSHTNICSSAARSGYFQWSGFDRPSPDYANAKVILLISSHLETGHYFNPHAQRIIEAQQKGGKIITMDPRLSNTASKSDSWLPAWPGSEPFLLLTFANHLIQNDLYNKEFVKQWVNWQETLEHFIQKGETMADTDELKALRSEYQGKADAAKDFENFDRFLKVMYAGYTFEEAAKVSELPIEKIVEAAEIIAECDGKLATHVWRAAAMAHKGGWQVARSLLFLNVLTGSVGTKGGTSGNSWNKFVPQPYKTPPAINAWNELHLPHEWPLVFYEMSFLLPHFLEEGRGTIDVYFSRVYNPMWINPDGFMWHKALTDESKMKCHVALTPTWNESAWFADYILPMGHSGERHDLMSQETHAGRWIGFRQPVRRVAMEKAGKKIQYTYEANPGEVWEENEFWVELTWRMDPDGSLGIREFVESPVRPGEPITQDEYWGWIFDNSVPGLPEKAKEMGLTPLEYMKKFGVFEVENNVYEPFKKGVEAAGSDDHGRALDKDGKVVGLMVNGEAKAGFNTPSKRLEFFSETMHQWGWPEKEYTVPWQLKSHVHQDNIDRSKGEMILLPNFRLPTLIHTRSANCKWLYEISHNNPLWINPIDADRIGVSHGDLVRVETEIGYFVDKAFVTEGIKPGVVACSHHLGRWKLNETGPGMGSGMASVVDLIDHQNGEYELKIKKMGGPWKSWDPDTERVWWEDVGVNQNLTHAAQPDPVAGHHCWHQKAMMVKKAEPTDKYGDVWVDTKKSMEVYQRWVGYTRSCVDHSPDGTRRPMWYNRPLKPVAEAYKLPEKPFGRD